jgi:hypothetical protein
MLKYPDPNKPFHIYPDANNDHAMGAMLLQDGEVVSTWSRKFNDAQKKYNITKKEWLAAQQACRHFHPIIAGCDIMIHSDHMNLTHNGVHHIDAQLHR